MVQCLEYIRYTLICRCVWQKVDTCYQTTMLSATSSDVFLTSQCSAPCVAVNTTLLAHIRPAAMDMNQKPAAPAADAPCSNRSILPTCGVHSSKPAASCCSGWMGHSDGHRTVTQTLPYTICQQCQQVSVQPRELGCQHGTARICCWAPCCGARHPPLSGCQSISPVARRSAANSPYAAADAVERWDRRTDRRTDAWHRAPHTTRAVPTGRLTVT